MKLASFKDLIRQTYHCASEDKIPRLAAALAFYTMISLAPLLVFTVGILSNFLEDARGQMIRQIRNLIGPVGIDAIVQVLNHAAEAGQGKRATLISIGLLLFGATGMFGELQESLNMIFRVRLKKKGAAFWRVIRKRLISILMVGLISALLLSTLFIQFFLRMLHDGVGEAGLLNPLIDSLVSISLISVLFALLYRYLPDGRSSWKSVWPASIMAASLFTLGKIIFGIYLRYATMTSAYGAAGSLAALLLWVYISAQILFFGAEFIHIYTKTCGEHVLPDEDATKTPEKVHPL